MLEKFPKTKNKLAEEIFLSFLQKYLNGIKNISPNKNKFLYIKKAFPGKKICFIAIKLFLFRYHFLESRFS